MAIEISRRKLLIGSGIGLAGLLGGEWLYNQVLTEFSAGNFEAQGHGIPVIYDSNALGKICAENTQLSGQISIGMRIHEEGGSGVTGVALVSRQTPTDFVMGYQAAGLLGITEYCKGRWTHLLRAEQKWTNGELLEIRKDGNRLQLLFRGERIADVVNTSIEGDSFYPGQYTNNISSRFSKLVYRTTLDTIQPSRGISTVYYTRGNGVISIRFDGGFNLDFELAMNYLSPRYLTAGFAIPRSLINQKNRLTFKQMDEMSLAGNEILCMGKNETSDPESILDFYEQTLVARYEMGLLGYEVYSFVQPDTWTRVWPDGYDIRSSDFWDSLQGAEIQKNFLAYEVNMEGKPHSMPVPAGVAYGASHINGNRLSGKDLCSLVDELIAGGLGVEVVFNSATMGTPGFISKPDFISFLDNLKQKRESGVLDVLNPTQLLYANAR